MSRVARFRNLFGEAIRVVDGNFFPHARDQNLVDGNQSQTRGK